MSQIFNIYCDESCHLEHDYVVILAERSGYYLLKTAFMVRPKKANELNRDWHASSRGRNG